MKDIGELFFVGFPDSLNEDAKKIIKEIRPGGIILYPSNMKDLHELEISMDILYEIMDKEDLPLFISSDHEGGQLETVPGILPSPGNSTLGRIDEEATTSYGAYLGKTLRSYGFNTLFAPVLDVWHKGSSPVTGLRAFSKDPEKVAKYGKLFIEALQREGIIATAKHFPGHGKAESDSHKVLPIVRPFNENDPDIIPFKEAIKSNVEMIMTAHIVYPDIDTLPATISEKILKGILKEKLGYQGVIISDAIEMQALFDNYSIEEMVYKFFKGGGDMFLIADGAKNLQKAYRALSHFIERGDIKEEELKEKIERIRNLKEKYVTKTSDILFQLDITKKAQEVNLRSKLSENPIFVIPSASSLSPADTTNRDLIKYEGLIGLLFNNPKILRYDIFTGKLDGEIEKDMEVISLVLDSFRFEGQKKMQKELGEKAKRVIYIILRDMGDIELYKDSEHIVTYSTKPISVYNALKMLK